MTVKQPAQVSGAIVYVAHQIQDVYERRPILVLGVFLLALPFVTTNFSLSTHVLVFALFAMAYNISLGETGLLTFGHAAFFGLGAYGAGMFLSHLSIPQWLGLISLAFGVGLALVGGLLVGLLSLRRKGSYLALITLAFAQMIYFVAFQWESLTGGDDGLFGISSPEIGIPGVFLMAVDDSIAGIIPGKVTFYVFVLTVVLLGIWGIMLIKQSHFGRALNAIRENENRARYLGYDVYRYKLAAFTVSAGFAGLAGALYPIYLNFVGLSTLHWVLSGEVNFFVLLGGIHSFGGPVIGTIVYFFLSDGISAFTRHWQLPVGAILIGIVLFFPNGILGTIQEYLPAEEPLESSSETDEVPVEE